MYLNWYYEVYLCFIKQDSTVRVAVCDCTSKVNSKMLMMMLIIDIYNIYDVYCLWLPSEDINSFKSTKYK